MVTENKSSKPQNKQPVKPQPSKQPVKPQPSKQPVKPQPGKQPVKPPTKQPAKPQPQIKQPIKPQPQIKQPIKPQPQINQQIIPQPQISQQIKPEPQQIIQPVDEVKPELIKQPADEPIPPHMLRPEFNKAFMRPEDDQSPYVDEPVDIEERYMRRKLEAEKNANNKPKLTLENVKREFKDFTQNVKTVCIRIFAFLAAPIAVPLIAVYRIIKKGITKKPQEEEKHVNEGPRPYRINYESRPQV